MQLGTRIATLMLASALMITLPACEDDSAPEEAGDSVYDAVNGN